MPRRQGDPKKIGVSHIMTDRNNDQQTQQAKPSEDRRGKLIFMSVIFIAAALIYLTIQRKGGELPNWPEDLGGAFKQAKDETRPVLLLLTTMPPSLDARKIGSISIKMNGPAIKEGRFITRLVRGRNSQPATKYEVKEFPTVIIFAPDGQELARRSGYIGQGDFRDMLKDATKPAAP